MVAMNLITAVAPASVVMLLAFMYIWIPKLSTPAASSVRPAGLDLASFP